MIPRKTGGFGSEIGAALGVKTATVYPTTFPDPSAKTRGGWRAYELGLPCRVFIVETEDEPRASEVRRFAAGIAKSGFILIFSSKRSGFLAVRPQSQSRSNVVIVPVRSQEDLERVATAARGLKFTDNELVASSSIEALAERLAAGAEKHYVNMGLFSSHYLNERLFPAAEKRGRKVKAEAEEIFRSLAGSPTSIFSALGYQWHDIDKTASIMRLSLRAGEAELPDWEAVVTQSDTLDYRSSGDVAPSYVAVSALSSKRWVILTNGRRWRLYSSAVSSPSTDYFEVDLTDVSEESDPRLSYFVSLFSAKSVARGGDKGSFVDSVFEDSRSYAREIEEDLRAKVFEGQLFLNLVRAVVDWSQDKKYTEAQLSSAKASALKLLYRLLFILYAEARGLLPVNSQKYSTISLEQLRKSLAAYEDHPDSDDAWRSLQTLFQAISMGDQAHAVPEYDGGLFQADPELDGLTRRNRFLVPALRDLTESKHGGVDYQNLGVRHLGSLYEALLQYSVTQAEKELMVYKDRLMEADYAKDLKQKPEGYVPKGEIYLSVRGLERKLTGSYYTPDELVDFLVEKGLEPHFEERRALFGKLYARYLDERNDEERQRLAGEMEDALLGLKVVDPAMGSGHFLVAAVNKIAEWVIGVLKDNPHSPLNEKVEEMRREIISNQAKKNIELDTTLLTDTVILKRLVMKQCVYGVDLNPLAVELAKLSLWLDSFTIGTPLTFLDHHIKTGNSLIGAGSKELSTPYKKSLDNWAAEFSQAGKVFTQEINKSADLDLKEIAETRKKYQETERTLRPYKLYLSLKTAETMDPSIGEVPPNKSVVLKALTDETWRTQKWGKPVDEGIRLASEYAFFHWELEFPEVFQDAGGFDLVLTNPPWDVVNPEDDNFFAYYLPDIRKLTNKQEKKKLFEKLLANLEIQRKYTGYQKKLENAVNFFRKSGVFIAQGKGNTNLWKLFLERCMKLLSSQGTLSIVLPSGIVTDEGGKPLREKLFEGSIKCLYEFENKEGIFPDVHRSTKFVLLAWQGGQASASFPAAFYLHSPTALRGEAEKEKFVKLPVKLVRTCAPESLSIPEVRNAQQLAVFEKLYSVNPLLNEASKQTLGNDHVFEKLYSVNPLLSDPAKGWSVKFMWELHRTNDSDLFRTDGKGWPLIEGKHFHQFIPDYAKPEFTVDPEQGLKRTAKHREYGGEKENRLLHESPRLAFRDVASSTNIRSAIACLLPPYSFSPHTVSTVVFKDQNGRTLLDQKYRLLSAYLGAVMNSYVFDFLIRTRVSAHLSFFYVYQTPVPADFSSQRWLEIGRLAARLNCVDDRYRGFAEALGSEWGPLTMAERVELTAKLNALVAKHYGLTKDEFEVILNSFTSFEEDEKIMELGVNFEWTDELVRKFNGEVRRRVLKYFVGEAE
jgi:hypothetical protein